MLGKPLGAPMDPLHATIEELELHYLHKVRRLDRFESDLR
jgi:hypothetical protein